MLSHSSCAAVGREKEISILILFHCEKERRAPMDLTLTGNEAKLAHSGLTFRFAHTILEQRIEVAERNERGWQHWLLLVLHDDGEALEHPHLQGKMSTNGFISISNCGLFHKEKKTMIIKGGGGA